MATVGWYVGISPAREGSRQNLRKRLRTHLMGNACGSTLRLTLGVLLAEELGLELRPVGGRLTFGDGERDLSAWMRENALVVWCATDNPWTVEQELLGLAPLPLNLEANARNPFAARLSVLRTEARTRCRE